MPFSILAVCLGNVCRSPLTERVLRLRLDDALGQDKGGVVVSSAGVQALAGHPMDERAAEQLTRLGGDPIGFTSTQLTPPMVGAADLVLTATLELRSRVLEEVPSALRRTFTLREFAALTTGHGQVADPAELVVRAARQRSDFDGDDYDIPDPIGKPELVHRQVAHLVATSCAATARALAPTLVPVPRS